MVTNSWRAWARSRALSSVVRQVGQDERRLLGGGVAAAGVGDVLQGLQAPHLERPQQVRGRRAEVGELVGLARPRRRQPAPGGVGVLQRDLAVEPRPAGEPLRLPVDLQLAEVVEQPGLEQVAEAAGRVPVELQVGGERLERLAGHREVLERPDLLVEEGGDRRVEGRHLGEEVVERRGGLDQRREVAGQGLQEGPLLVAVEEDQVDRGRLPAVIPRAGGQRDHGLQQVPGPVDQQLTLPGCLPGRPVGHADDGAAAPRIGAAVPAGDDQAAEQVEAVVEVVVLGVDVDADEVRVQVRRRDGQRAGALAGDVAQGRGAVLADAMPEAAGAVDQLVQPGSDRPGGGQAPDLGLAARGGDEVAPAARLAGGEVLERGEGPDGRDAVPPQGLLLDPGQVGQEREVLVLGAPLHAELVVEAAVALVVERERHVVERGPGHPAGGRVGAGHEVVGRAEVGVGVGDEFQQGVVQAEPPPGRLPEGLDLAVPLPRWPRPRPGRRCPSRCGRRPGRGPGRARRA